MQSFTKKENTIESVVIEILSSRRKKLYITAQKILKIKCCPRLYGITKTAGGKPI